MWNDFISFFLGKTTTILAASRDLFGDIWRSRILELNASDERGIAVVRDKIKNFSQQTVSNSASTKVPPFKIVILDEADRFVFNYSNKLADQSPLGASMLSSICVGRLLYVGNGILRSEW